MSAEPLAAGEPLRCPDCDEAVLGEQPYGELGAKVLLSLDCTPGAGDLVAVQFGRQWGVRDRGPREEVPASHLRRRHWCMPHPYSCCMCGRPARLSAGGAWCERCRR